MADVVARRWPAGSRVLVLCGPGNNGGDGFVAARVLVQRGYRVVLHLLGDRDRLSGDAAWAAGLVERARRSRFAWADPAAADVVVDAIFGAGLSRAIDGEALGALRGGARERHAGRRRGRAVRRQRRHGASAGRRSGRKRDGDVLPPQAGASSLSGPRSVRPAPASPTSASGTTCWT